MKRLKTLPVAVSEEDLQMLDLARALSKAFPPARSALACSLIRDGINRLLKGETTLEAIYKADYTAAIASTGVHE
jgi:hypothetical protein